MSDYSKPKQTYVGDGLYASFDGFQFRLWTDRSDGRHEVFLEDQVYSEFRRWADWILATDPDEAKPQ